MHRFGFEGTSTLGNFQIGAFSPDGSSYALGDDLDLHVWDVRQTSEPITHKRAESGIVQVYWENRARLAVLEKKNVAVWTSAV